jgi:hypothetical protein
MLWLYFLDNLQLFGEEHNGQTFEIFEDTSYLRTYVHSELLHTVYQWCKYQSVIGHFVHAKLISCTY